MSKWKINIMGIIVDEDGKGVLSEIEGSREQIVREHNAHEELVNACELANEVLGNLRNGKNYIADVLLCLENIETALKNAKGNK